MRAVVQRVKSAKAEVDGRVVGSIRDGVVVFLGIAEADTNEDVAYLAEKIANLRVFEDDEGKLNLSVKEMGGAALVISNFTLYGDCRKGRRPSFTEAAGSEKGRIFYQHFVEELKRRSVPVATGEFQAYMQVHVQNDGPVTLLLDSGKVF